MYFIRIPESRPDLLKTLTYSNLKLKFSTRKLWKFIFGKGSCFCGRNSGWNSWRISLWSASLPKFWPEKLKNTKDKMKEEADSPFFFGIRQPLWSDEQLIAEFLKNNINSKAIWSLNSWKIREANGFRYYVRIVCIKWTYKIKIIYPSYWVQTCFTVNVF